MTVVVLVASTQSMALAAEWEERRFTLLDRELDYLLAIWPGEYDNQEQLRFEADWGTEDSKRHRRIHSAVRRVDLPEFGDSVLYVEEYWDVEPAELYRQRLYVLSADEDSGAIRVSIHSLTGAEAFLGAIDNPSLLSDLQLENTQALPGCDMLLRRDLDGFVGAMTGKDCHFGEGDEHRYTEWQMQVDASSYWFRNRERDFETDEPLMSLAGYSWHKLERARRFVCMIDFPRESGGRPVETAHYAQLHDQGGQYSFVYPDGRDMTLVMRNYWSHEMQRETFMVAVVEGTVTGPTLVYGWGEPGADRIGVNPGWIRAQCDLDTAENRSLQHFLRPDS